MTSGNLFLAIQMFHSVMLRKENELLVKEIMTQMTNNLNNRMEFDVISTIMCFSTRYLLTKVSHRTPLLTQDGTNASFARIIV